MADVCFSAAFASIGRNTHPEGTAGARIRYILRDGALVHVVARGIPDTPDRAAGWINAEELGDRANARVCDTVVLALPHELTHEQRIKLVCDWCTEISGGVRHIIAIHRPSIDGDQRNHHAHVLFRDRHPTTGARVMRTTDRDFVERARISWARRLNIAMGEAGLDGRADHRSYARRGIDRIAQLHVGAAGTAAERKRAKGLPAPELVSKPTTVRKSKGKKGQPVTTPTRVVDWPAIDQGRSRFEGNAQRMAANAAAERAAAGRERAAAKAAMQQRLANARALMASLGLDVGLPSGVPQTPAPPTRRPGASPAAAELAMRPAQSVTPPTVTPARASNRSAAAALALDAAAHAAMQGAYRGVSDRHRGRVAESNAAAARRDAAARAGMQAAYAAAPAWSDRIETARAAPDADVAAQPAPTSPHTSSPTPAIDAAQIARDAQARDAQAAFLKGLAAEREAADREAARQERLAAERLAAEQESARQERMAAERQTARLAAEGEPMRQAWAAQVARDAQAQVARQAAVREPPAPTTAPTPMPPRTPTIAELADRFQDTPARGPSVDPSDPSTGSHPRGRVDDPVERPRRSGWTTVRIAAPPPGPALTPAPARTDAGGHASPNAGTPGVQPVRATPPAPDHSWRPRTVTGDEVHFYTWRPADGGPPSPARMAGLEGILAAHRVVGASKSLFATKPGPDPKANPARILVRVTYGLRALQDMLDRMRARQADIYQHVVERFRWASEQSDRIYDALVRPWEVARAGPAQASTAAADAPAPAPDPRTPPAQAASAPAPEPANAPPPLQQPSRTPPRRRRDRDLGL